ncbi:MAG: CHAT domain-containing protein [Clostridia bacterium]|nr:CHAT domain-containing protein [Deltaproteobacteria bacterium]
MPALRLVELTIRAQLARTEQGAGDVDTAIGIKDGLAQAHESLANAPKALTQLLEMGVIYSIADRNVDAERMLVRCAELAHDSKHIANEADCQSRLGSVYKALSQNDKAQASYEKALALYESIGNANAVVSRRFLALLYETARNDTDKALALYAKAYDDAVIAKETKRLPQLQLDIARVHRKRGDYALALDAIAKARTVIPVLSTATLKTPDDIADAKWDASNRTDVALETANVQWYRGNYPQAYNEQRSALTQAYAAYDVARMIQATSLGGLIAMNQGELGDANTALNGALDLARGIGLKREVAAQLDNLGIVLQSQGRRDEAEAHFREALELDTELGNNEGQAFDLRALASVLEKNNRIDESLATVEKALTISRTIGSKYNEAQCLYVKGRALHHSGKLDEATTSFDEAQTLAGSLSIPEVAWRSIYAMGRIAEAKGDPKLARARFDQALVIAEQLALAGSNASEDESRETLYNDAVRLTIDAKDFQSAFRIVERWHGRALLDLVSSSDVALPSDEARRLLANVQREDEAVVTTARELQRGKVTPAQHASAKTAYDVALKALFAAYPGIARTFVIAPCDLAETQKALPARTAVAMYIVNLGQTDVLIIKPASIEHVRIGVSSNEVRDLTSRYRVALRAFGEVDALGRSIATALLAPLAPVLGDVSHVVIVPQGPLSGMPFAALPYKDGVLVDVITTSYAPSASFLTDTLNKPKRTAPRKVYAIAYGDDLPFARLEALALAGKDALTGPLATESSVRTARADAFDLAVHGDVNDDAPLRARLTLARSATDDGQLELREVFGLEATAPLVTLSSCALGTDGPAWQAIGSAFIASGAQTVVASHERISDLAAGVLMKRFYRESRLAQSGAEALRAAQRWTRAHFAHPAHWATFGLIGDFR